MSDTWPSVRDVKNPIISRPEDKPPTYLLEAYRAMARTAAVDPRDFCAMHFRAFPNEITREAVEALIRELKPILARLEPAARAANERQSDGR